MILVIDVMNMLFRGKFSSNSRVLSTPEGFDITATYGSLKIMIGLLRKLPLVTEVICCSDPIKSVNHDPDTDRYLGTWRKTYCPDYKANRNAVKHGQKQEGMRQSVYANAPYFRGLCQLLNIVWMEDPQFEADDLLAWVAHYYKPETDMVIMSGDRDVFQLLRYPNVEIMYPVKSGYETLNRATFYQQSAMLVDKKAAEAGRPRHLEHDCWLPWRCMVGDLSDNIAGLPGCGKATGHDIIQLGMQHTKSRHPIELFGAWKHALTQTGPKIGKREARLIASQDAPDLLARNHYLMHLDGRRAQNTNGFFGTANPDAIEKWFRAVNFKSLLPGGGSEADYQMTLGSLQCLQSSQQTYISTRMASSTSTTPTVEAPA